MAVIVPIVSKFDDKGIKKAQAQFGNLGSSLKGALGAAGIALSLGAITNGLRESTMAASSDVKSQALLATQLRNTTGASKEQIDAVEASIKAMQLQAAVADDDIRPAFASLVRATGDVTRATSLTSLALDVAAGTGKDLGAVSLALGKAVNGSTTSLLKLVPSIKGASDPMAELAVQFNGAAEAAANNDPFQRLTIVMGELQEQIGMYLLPYLSEFADYISSPDGQTAIKEFGDGVGTIAANILQLGKNLGSDEFLNGTASFSAFLAQLSGGDFGGALDILNKRQSELSKSMESPAMRDLRLGVKLKSSNKAVAEAAKKEIAAIAAAEKATRAAYNRYSALDAQGKAQGLNLFSDGTIKKQSGPGGGDEGKGSAGKSAALKAAEAAAKAAADKAARARQAIIDAAQDASDKAKQAFDDLKAAVDDFNKSFAVTADAFKAVFKVSAPLGEFEQQAVDAFQSMKDAAQAAFDSGLFGKKDGATALANLKAYADREQALLQGIAKDRDVLAKKISIAQSVTAGVMGSLNLTSMLETETKQVTQSVTKMVDGIALTTTRTFDEVVSGGLADSFKKLVDKTKAFASNLTKLKALGLNGNLFKQIVDAGAESGNATAEAIIAGGAAAVTELNGLFTELTDAGAEIAKTSTPILYDLGENMTNSFIEGLRSQDQMLIDSANSMAALFTEQFKSQLNLAIAPTLQGAQSTAVQMQSALDLSKRPDPKRSPQSYASWLSSIGGIDPVRSPESYARAQTSAGATYNITVEAGLIANKQEIPAMIVDALGTYTRQSGAGGLNRVLGIA